MYRLIIADDEQIECRALENKIRAMTDQIQLLESVHDGISLLRRIEEQQPDIAIVDINMPGLSGLDAIELLRQKRIQLKIIINTAYSDFSYAQRALQLGADNYLLKPGTQEALQEALRNACRQLDEQRRDHSERERNREAASNLYDVAAEKWIISLMFGEQDEKCFDLLTQRIPEVRMGGIFTVWRKLGAAQNGEKFSGRICKALEPICRSVGANHRGAAIVFLCFGGEERRDVEDLAEEAIHYARRRLGADQLAFAVGVGRAKADVKEYEAGLHEAWATAQSSETEGAVFFRSPEEDVHERSPLSGLEISCAKMLLDRKTEEVIKLVQRALSFSQRKGTRAEAVHIHALLFMAGVEMEIEARTAGQRRMPALAWDAYRKAEGDEGVLQWLEESLSSWARTIHQRRDETTYVDKAMNFIHENHGSDISLEETAEAIGISSFYLSRLFKQEGSLTFVEILTDIRVRRALRMMIEGKKTMKEICQKIGYVNMTYFYKVFKKTTGFTVGEMKPYL